MKKLKVPQLIENSELPKSMTQKEFEQMYSEKRYLFVPEFTFDIDGLVLTCDLDYFDSPYVYAYICGDGAEYYDYAIVKTDDIYFNTYAEWRKAVKTLTKQLVSRWKQWVSTLYEVKE